MNMRLTTLSLFFFASCLLAEAAFVIDSSSSEESSEETVEVKSEDDAINDNKESLKGEGAVEEEDDVTDDCQKRCVQQELRNNNVYTQILETSCRTGCEAQEDIVSLMKLEFPQTALDLVSKTALDKCWDACLTKDLAKAQFCITGCSAMNGIQMAKLENLANKKEEEDKSIAGEKGDLTDENIPSANDNKIGEENQDLEVKGQDIKPETSVLDNEDFNDAEETNGNFKAILTFYILDRFFSDYPAADDARMLGGQRDDNDQLGWPLSSSGSQAMTAVREGIPSVYDQVSSSLEQLKDNVGRAVESPGFQENLFYILLGLTGLLLLNSVFNSILCPAGSQPEGEASPVKLPTYDECIKADKDMGIVEQEYKINLSLPVVTVAVKEEKEKSKEAVGGEEEQNI